MTNDEANVAYLHYLKDALNKEIKERQKELYLLQSDMLDAHIQLRFSKEHPELYKELIK